MLNVAELDERIEKCLAILAENPHSQVFAALADAYRKRGEFGRAFSVCKSGLKQHPDYAPAHIVLAKLYLHQGMYSDAHVTLEKAITLDGRTRASDLLEAETLIGLGDKDGARQVLDRLRVSDRHNPAVKELMHRLNQREAPTPTESGETGLAEPDSQESSSPVPEERVPGSAPEPMSWEEWAETVTALPAVEQAFAFESGGHPLAGLGDSEDSSVSAVGSMFAEIDSELQKQLHVRLEELRIERSGGEVWCRRDDQGIIGFMGGAGLPFGAARQAAISNAAKANSATRPESDTQQQGR